MTQEHRARVQQIINCFSETSNQLQCYSKLQLLSASAHSDVSMFQEPMKEAQKISEEVNLFEGNRTGTQWQKLCSKGEQNLFKLLSLMESSETVPDGVTSDAFNIFLRTFNEFISLVNTGLIFTETSEEDGATPDGKVSIDELKEKIANLKKQKEQLERFISKQESEHAFELKEMKKAATDAEKGLSLLKKQVNYEKNELRSRMNTQLKEIKVSETKKIAKLRDDVKNLEGKCSKLVLENELEEAQLRKKKNKLEIECLDTVKVVEERVQEQLDVLQKKKFQMKEDKLEIEKLRKWKDKVELKEQKEARDLEAWKKYLAKEQEKMNIYHRGAAAVQKLYRGWKGREEFRKFKKKNKKGKKKKKK